MKSGVIVTVSDYNKRLLSFVALEILSNIYLLNRSDIN